jgi:hypothetical protein
VFVGIYREVPSPPCARVARLRLFPALLRLFPDLMLSFPQGCPSLVTERVIDDSISNENKIDAIGFSTGRIGRKRVDLTVSRLIQHVRAPYRVQSALRMFFYRVSIRSLKSLGIVAVKAPQFLAECEESAAPSAQLAPGCPPSDRNTMRGFSRNSRESRSSDFSMCCFVS